MSGEGSPATRDMTWQKVDRRSTYLIYPSSQLRHESLYEDYPHEVTPPKASPPWCWGPQSNIRIWGHILLVVVVLAMG